MSREQYIKRLIREHGITIKEFAQRMGMSYSTLLSMLGSSIGGIDVESAIWVCRSLGVTVEDLQQHARSFDEDGGFHLTEEERRLVSHYRARPEMQAAIGRLLELDVPKTPPKSE